MRRIDELHLELPFYGSRRMTFELNKEGRGVNRKRVQRLMRVMSNTNDASFCAAALEEALLRFGKPRIFNTDSQRITASSWAA